MSDAEQAQTSGEPPAKPSTTRRLVHIVAAVLVVVVLPALLMYAVAGELGVSAMFVGVLLGAVGAKLGGTRRMLYVAPVVGLAAGLGAFTAYGWWWVVVLAAAGLITGAGIGFGWLPPLLMIPYAATFVTPVSTVTGVRQRWPLQPQWSSGPCWAAAPRSVWRWAGPSPTGYRNRF